LFTIKNTIESSCNTKREVAGLVEACRALDLHSGLILTYGQEEERTTKGVNISVLPVWKWFCWLNGLNLAIWRASMTTHS
jgi:predicted AAA+ superfamily ATPase